MKFLRRLLEDPRAVDSVVVVLATWFLLGGYVTAYAYVHVQGQVLQPAAQAGQTVVAAAWSLLTLYLFAGFATGLRAGRVSNRALPDRQPGTFAAALASGAALIVDNWFYSPLFGTARVAPGPLLPAPHLRGTAPV